MSRIDRRQAWVDRMVRWDLHREESTSSEGPVSHPGITVARTFSYRALPVR